MSNKPTNTAEIKEAFRKIDRKILQKKLDISENVMSQIANGLDTVSAKRAKEIEIMTCGVVPASVLRPDIFK